MNISTAIKAVSKTPENFGEILAHQNIKGSIIQTPNALLKSLKTDTNNPKIPQNFYAIKNISLKGEQIKSTDQRLNQASIKPAPFNRNPHETNLGLKLDNSLQEHYQKLIKKTKIHGSLDSREVLSMRLPPTTRAKLQEILQNSQIFKEKWKKKNSSSIQAECAPYAGRWMTYFTGEHL